MGKDFGYPVTQHTCATTRYVQLLNLRNDPELIREYRRLHSREDFWPEIGEGIRRAGVLAMDIYIHGCTLCMIVELPADKDFDEVMNIMSQQPRQSEWEALVGRYQQCAEGASSAAKWQRMERMFTLY